MKKIILILVLNFSAVLAFAKHDRLPSSQQSELQKNFLKAMNIKLGEYDLEDGDSNCWSGPLEIIDFTDELTLMLGARPLAMEIGKAKSKEEEQGCTLTYETNYSSTEINETREKICKSENIILVTKIVPKKDKLSYSRKITLNGKVITDISCNLKLISDKSK